MAQLQQLPQSHITDLPLRFFLTMPIITAATIPMSAAHIMTVQKLAASHWSIVSTPFYFFVSLFASL